FAEADALLAPVRADERVSRRRDANRFVVAPTKDRQRLEAHVTTITSEPHSPPMVSDGAWLNHGGSTTTTTEIGHNPSVPHAREIGAGRSARRLEERGARLHPVAAREGRSSRRSARHRPRARGRRACLAR